MGPMAISLICKACLFLQPPEDIHGPPPTIGLGTRVYTAGWEDLDRIRDIIREQGKMSSTSTKFTVSSKTCVLDIDPGPEEVPTVVTRDAVVIYSDYPPVPIEPDPVERNEDARDSHQVDDACQKYGLTGRGVVVGVWDGGAVRASHAEFAEERARQGDACVRLSQHATHVAGTIGARGVRPRCGGMAPGASLVCFDWEDDLDEVRSAEPVSCSNHSYGFLCGWHFHDQNGWMWFGDPAIDIAEDANFGKYTGESYAVDAVLVSRPELSMFVAAGNDRNDAPPTGVAHWVRNSGSWQRSLAVRKADNWDRGGFDTIEDRSVAKNVITIGAIEDITRDPPLPQDVRVTGFSGWGPTDDGRIKPDLVANGWQLESTDSSADDSYANMSGTSMATPAAAGTAAVLSELFKDKNGRLPFADEMKGILIHTAMSEFDRPTYRLGWGSIRADHAADAIDAKQVHRYSMADGTLELVGQGVPGQPIRVTAVWIDAPGRPHGRGLDERTPVLVRDCDLTVVSPSSDTRFPWSLDAADPTKTASCAAPNRVDNVERVDIPGAEVLEGPYRVRVSGPAGNFHVALVISGLEITGAGAAGR